MRTRTPRIGLEVYDHALQQLRHACAVMARAEAARWTPVERQRLAEVVRLHLATIDELLQDYVRSQDDLAAVFAANAKHRRHDREAERELLAHAHEIASASQARRIITTVFSRIKERP
jgi:hypothetical protein